MDWSAERMSGASIAAQVGRYEAVPQSDREYKAKVTHPQLFEFDTVSVGDNGGQLFFVPLDESSRENAEFILEAIKFYVKSLEKQQ